MLLQVLCTLRFYATGPSTSARCQCADRCTPCQLFCGNANSDIYVPRSARQINAMKADLYNLAGFPKVLGTTDGSMAPI